MNSISRRDFLKMGCLTLGSLAFSSFLPEFSEFGDIELVRVAYRSVSIYKEPNDKSQIVGTCYRDDLVHVYETVQAETPQYNPIWYRVFGGYMHRERLQKVRISYNPPLSSVPASKLIAELTVPYVQPYRYDQWRGWYPLTFRMYYTSIHWISAVEQGPNGEAWYRIQDEADKNLYYYVPAVQLRPIAADEFTSLAANIPSSQKHIDVNIHIQTLTAFENDSLVFTADVSTGLIGLYDTPVGNFNIQDKLPSRRMQGANLFASDDENVLVGVPWTCFFTDLGHAFHGTYWHDNFGLPMSHGCVNMRTEDAKWLYRWSRPLAGFEDINLKTLDVRGYGTSVYIHR